MEPPRRGFFLAKKFIFRNFGHGHFSKNEFSSKTRFLGHLFELISRKSGSYGPYGPFRFSEKNEIRYVNFHQNLTFWRKPDFPDYWENELILLGLFSEITPFLDSYPDPIPFLTP